MQRVPNDQVPAALAAGSGGEADDPATHRAGSRPETVFLRPTAQALAGSVRDLFTQPYRAATLLPVVRLRHELFQPYLLVSWLPTLLTGAGWLPAQALRAMAFNQVGGIVGGLGLAALMDRFGAERTLVMGFALNALALLLFLVVPPGFLSWGALLLVVGACTGLPVRNCVVGSRVIRPPSSLPAAVGRRPWRGSEPSSVRWRAARSCPPAWLRCRHRRPRRAGVDLPHFDAGVVAGPAACIAASFDASYGGSGCTVQGERR